MKPLNRFAWIGALLILFTAPGCASLSSDPGSTTVHISGPPGAQINVDYWQKGQRVHSTALLPWDFENQQQISRIKICKVNPADVITVEAHYSDGKCQTMLTRKLPAGTGVLNITVQHGLIMKMVSN